MIEQLGGYEEAKMLRGTTSNALLDMKTWTVHVDDIDLALLEHRRANNIFEVGDKVVHHKFSNIKIYEVCEISGDLLTVFYDRKTHSFKTDIRHATDEEIEAGRRL